MSRFGFLRAIAGVALGALALAGCGGGGGSAPTGDIINVGNGAEPEGLDPHIVTGIPEHHIISTLFEGLVRMDPSGL